MVAARVVAAASFFLPTTEAHAQKAGGEDLEVTIEGGKSATAFVGSSSTDSAPREVFDTGDLVEGLPSVHVRRLGGDGAFAALTVRGAASNQVGVVLDGIPLVSAGDPAADVGALPIWPSARVRVFRGFAPARLGTTGYLGGLLCIDPPVPEAGERTESWLAAGSFGSLKMRVAGVRRAGDLRIASAVTASRSDGDFEYEALGPTGDLERRVRSNSGHAGVAGLGRVALLRPWGSVAATILADVRRTGLPGPEQHPTEVASLDSSRGVLGLRAMLRDGGHGAWHAGAWARVDRANVSDPRRELDPTARRDDTETVVQAFGGSGGWRGRPHDGVTVDAFADGRVERFVPVTGDVGVSARRLALGLGADAEWRATDRLVVAVSGRLDGRDDTASGVLGVLGVPLEGSSEVAPSGNVGVAYRVSGAATLSVHAGARQRPPGFIDLFGNRGVIVGNPQLSTERSLSVDAGASGGARVSGARLAWEVVGFASSVRDLITLVPLGRGTFRPDNVDQAAVAGGELSLALLGRHVQTSATYTLSYTRNLGDDPTVRGEPLPGRPMHDLAYDAAWSLGPAGLRYSLDVVAGTTVDLAGAVELPPRVLHGAGAWLDVPGAPGLRIGLQIDNLLDVRTMWLEAPTTVEGSIPKPVSDFLGFPLPGRTIWATVRYRIGGD